MLQTGKNEMLFGNGFVSYYAFLPKIWVNWLPLGRGHGVLSYCVFLLRAELLTSDAAYLTFARWSFINLWSILLGEWFVASYHCIVCILEFLPFYLLLGFCLITIYNLLPKVAFGSPVNNVYIVCKIHFCFLILCWGKTMYKYEVCWCSEASALNWNEVQLIRR